MAGCCTAWPVTCDSENEVKAGSYSSLAANVTDTRTFTDLAAGMAYTAYFLPKDIGGAQGWIEGFKTGYPAVVNVTATSGVATLQVKLASEGDAADVYYVVTLSSTQAPPALDIVQAAAGAGNISNVVEGNNLGVIQASCACCAAVSGVECCEVAQTLSYLDPLTSYALYAVPRLRSPYVESGNADLTQLYGWPESYAEMELSFSAVLTGPDVEDEIDSVELYDFSTSFWTAATNEFNQFSLPASVSNMTLATFGGWRTVSEIDLENITLADWLTGDARTIFRRTLAAIAGYDNDDVTILNVWDVSIVAACLKAAGKINDAVAQGNFSNTFNHLASFLDDPLVTNAVFPWGGEAQIGGLAQSTMICLSTFDLGDALAAIKYTLHWEWFLAQLRAKSFDVRTSMQHGTTVITIELWLTMYDVRTNQVVLHTFDGERTGLYVGMASQSRKVLQFCLYTDCVFASGLKYNTSHHVVLTFAAVLRFLPHQPDAWFKEYLEKRRLHQWKEQWIFGAEHCSDYTSGYTPSCSRLEYHSYLDGKVDNIRVWVNSRSDADLQETRFHRIEACGNGLLVDWVMDDGIVDSSGNSTVASWTARDACRNGQPFIWLNNPGLQWDDPIVIMCDPSCKKCVGPDVTDCTECYDEVFFYEGACVNTTPCAPLASAPLSQHSWRVAEGEPADADEAPEVQGGVARGKKECCGDEGGGIGEQMDEPETDQSIIRDLMDDVLDKVELLEKDRLEQDQAFGQEGIDKLMRARSAKHKRQLEDLQKIKARFLQRTAEIYGNDSDALGAVHRRAGLGAEDPSAGEPRPPSLPLNSDRMMAIGPSPRICRRPLPPPAPLQPPKSPETASEAEADILLDPVLLGGASACFLALVAAAGVLFFYQRRRALKDAALKRAQAMLQDIEKEDQEESGLLGAPSKAWGGDGKDPGELAVEEEELPGNLRDRLKKRSQIATDEMKAQIQQQNAAPEDDVFKQFLPADKRGEGEDAARGGPQGAVQLASLAMKGGTGALSGSKEMQDAFAALNIPNNNSLVLEEADVPDMASQYMAAYNEAVGGTMRK
eukprot:gene1488-2115_t